jgi:hypothetical protein
MFPFDLNFQKCFFRLLMAGAVFSRHIRAEGVTTSVKTVEKLRPKTIAVESWTHHCVEGAP